MERIESSRTWQWKGAITSPARHLERLGNIGTAGTARREKKFVGVGGKGCLMCGKVKNLNPAVLKVKLVVEVCLEIQLQ